MDFAKAFDKVPHNRLLIKMQRYGIRGKTLQWTESFLTQRKQRVVIDGKCSEWVNVDSSVPQGTVTGPLDFLMFINDLPEKLSSNVKLFADDCIVYRKIAGSEDAGNLQKDLDMLTEWQSRWQMKFNAKKCYVLKITHARKTHDHKYTLNGTAGLQNPQDHGTAGPRKKLTPQKMFKTKKLKKIIFPQKRFKYRCRLHQRASKCPLA